MPHIAGQERRTNVRRGYIRVAISFRPGRLPGMKFGRRLGRFKHPDRGRQNSFSAMTRFSGGMGDWVAKVATWPRACTPASVRPEPWGKTFSPVTRSMAEASVPWIVAAPGLDLPSGELRAVIGQDQFEIAHAIVWSLPGWRLSSNRGCNSLQSFTWRSEAASQSQAAVSAILFHSLRASGAGCTLTRSKRTNGPAGTKMKPGACILRTIA